MKIKLLLVEPIYQINLGYIARTAKNFGINKLYMVNPKCNPTGNQAIKFSKHARELLENAVIYENIEEALKGSKFVVGTTAIWKKADEAKSNIYTLNDFITKFKNIKELTILIGRDNTGLTKREMKMCDASIYIPANPDYPTLNISHAVAIILYELNKFNFLEKEIDKKYADSKSINSLLYLFKNFVESSNYVRKKQEVERVFSHLIRRSNPTKEEMNTIKAAFNKKK
jgi:tRNA/rRNA methyltransferase